jgi:ATP:corrinoid adenosyltransferase
MIAGCFSQRQSVNLNECEAKEIIKLADMASEVKEIKQHYAAGINGGAGIGR